ncbi:hypothetical protein TNCV_3502582 [Trichonephila clavipes]|uniref:Major facilitator superfamily (MFS) profile domain-containing protein n=1 Tax=Trichonephila clavipes TaxID=2585209 RepID=A0A8X6V2N6_TRICX|nr:hypothetical protein TNCV_3502582 [Trichonephila clavipes]
MKTAGWSTRRVAGQVHRSESAVRNCSEQWTREGTHARKTGSGATRKTTRREGRRIVRQALVDPTVTRSTIRADVSVAIVPQTISIHLAEANLKSKYPFRALPLTPEHRQLRLQWCQARSMWNVTDWQKFVFSDESRFVLGTDDYRVRVWSALDLSYIVSQGQFSSKIMLVRIQQELLKTSYVIFTLPWPARTPDLSPVEHVWDQLKRQMPSCHSIHDLELAVQDLWAHLPQEVGVPKRFVFSIVGFLASTIAISLATNLGIVIVTMEDRSNETTVHHNASKECHSSNISFNLQSTQKATLVKHGEFDWSPEIEGLAIGAVYYGQLLGYMPGGRMAEVYGGKRTLIIFLFLASFFTAVTPFAVRFSVYIFIACRFFIGVGTAPVIPVLFYMISRWIPESERSFNASFILAGYGVGAFVSFLSSGLLCAADFMGGWPSVFYVGGFGGFSWCLLCYLLIYETPEEHPSITNEELKYISQELGKIEQIQNGELSCVPPLIRAIFACIWGYPADLALRKGYVKKIFIRKSATIINSIFASLGFVGIMLAGCNALLTTIFFTIGGLLGDFVTFGVCMGGVDIAPNLSGTVTGILNFVGVVPFFLIPALVGFFTQHERSMVQWRYVYYVTIGVVLFTTLMYAVFGTSEPQKWGTHDEEPMRKIKKAKRSFSTVGGF